MCETNKWINGNEKNKWVTCLSCYFEYYIEDYQLSPNCPICESYEYEESETHMSIVDLGSLGGDHIE